MIMETMIEIFKNNVPANDEEADESCDVDEFQELIQTLPKEKHWYGTHLYFYQGFWCPSIAFKGMISFQKHFQALDTDIILTSAPKSGTTWLKALIFMIVNRNNFAFKDSPLLISSPHKLVPFFEFDVYRKNPSSYLENKSDFQPRIFATHAPYASLPPSITGSNAKIVYICRNPMDMFISIWHFADKLRGENVEPLSLDEAFEMFCQGKYSFGPFEDHVSGYWKANQENPNKILFLKYEDLKENINYYIKKLAEFLGFAFSSEEEKQGVVEEIGKLCCFENMKELEANKSGKLDFGHPHNAFFRKAQVGDWSNYLAPSMVDRLEKLFLDKLELLGLTFKLS
ncbi:hypothetical protein PTKIN_Ptkin06aG0149600 [Pterospermum kingtungense]